MTLEEMKSDLIDLVHHEHDHMARLFGDLCATFGQFATGDLDDEEVADAIDTAQDDLAAAYDELLEHFSREEEVFFVRMETRFPELREEIAELVRTHEFVCDRTRWLRAVLRDRDAMMAKLPQVRETLTTLQTTLHHHTTVENEIFGHALRQMTVNEREALLQEMRAVG